MAYSQNPNLPRVRMEAVELVKYHGWSIRQAARRFGFSHCAVRLWLLRRPEYGRYGRLVIPTRSSRPLHHPDELSPEIIKRILDLRSERQQCAEILHHRLKQEGILVSMSSIKASSTATAESGRRPTTDTSKDLSRRFRTTVSPEFRET